MAVKPRIAIVHDNPLSAESLLHLLEDDDRYEPVHFPKFTDVDSAVVMIMAQANAAVCDHELRPHNYASFDGSELVSRLVAEGLPAVLRTAHKGDRTDPSLRRDMRRLPVILGSESKADEIISGLDKTDQEIKGIIATERLPYGTGIIVIDATQQGNTWMFRGIIVARDPDADFIIPAASLPTNIVEALKGVAPTGPMFLRADVNVHAADPAEMFFDNVELMPEARQDDGLFVVDRS